MQEQRIKEKICEIGRRVWSRGYVAANDGNFSMRVNENRVISTPTQISKGFMNPSDMVVVDLEGNQLKGERKKTSEVLLHLTVYKHRPDVKAIVHAHPPHATAFAIARRPLPRGLLPEVEYLLGEIPIAEYATPSTGECSQVILPLVEDYNAMLLANHGAVTFGSDLEEAYQRMEIIEQYCSVLLYLRQIGVWEPLGEERLSELLALKEKAGLTDRRNRDKQHRCPAPVDSPIPSFNLSDEKALKDLIKKAVREVLEEQKQDT